MAQVLTVDIRSQDVRDATSLLCSGEAFVAFGAIGGQVTQNSRYVADSRLPEFILGSARKTGVSIVVPAYSAESTIRECLKAITMLRWHGELEVIVVNDGSADATAEVASTFKGVKVLNAPHRGIAHATNLGIKTALHEIVLLVDADAVLEQDWLNKALRYFDSPDVAAVAGRAVTANSSIIGKIMGYDVEARLRRVPVDTDQLYTMNTAFRRRVLIEVGLFNEKLKAGQDVDLSRRLKVAGYRLLLPNDVTCKHYWKDTLGAYIRQQYSYAYYRMELVRMWKKPYDSMTPLRMILQVPFTIAIVLAAGIGGLQSPLSWLPLLILALAHVPQALNLIREKRDVSMAALPLLFTLRNICWVFAMMVWMASFVTAVAGLRKRHGLWSGIHSVLLRII